MIAARASSRVAKLAPSGSARHDSAWTAAGYLASTLSAFAVTWIAARAFTKDDVAILGWATSAAALASVLAGIGSSQEVIRVISGQPAGVQSERLRTLTRVVLACSAIAMVAWLAIVGPALAAASRTDGYQVAIVAVALWIPTGALLQLHEAAARARREFKLAAFLGPWIRRSIVIVILLAVAAQLIDLAIGMTLIVAGAIEAALVGGWIVRYDRRLDPGAASEPGAAIGRTIRDSLTHLPLTISAVVVPQAGVWLAALVTSSDHVADVSVAVRVTLLTSIPYLIGGRVFSPRIADNVPAASLELAARRFANFATALTAAALVVFVAAGPWLLGTVFGAEYRSAASALVVLTIGQLVAAATGLGGQFLNFRGYQHTVAWIAGLGSIAYVPLTLALAALWDAWGVGLAATIVMVGQNVALMELARRWIGVRTWPTLHRRPHEPVP